MKLEAEIIRELLHNSQGLQFKTLAKKLKMFSDGEKAELRKCLNNLACDRIITFNHKKDVVNNAKENDFIYKGIITINKHTGDGYLKSGRKLFIIRRDYLKGALDGDTVLIKSSNTEFNGKINAVVEKIVERKEITITGVYNNGNVTVLSSKQKLQLNPEEAKDIKENSIIDVKVNKTLIGEFICEQVDPEDKYYLEKSIALKYGFPLEFSNEAMTEAENISENITETELNGRLDLRDLPIITIDCDSTKDMDDAVYARQLENGNYEIIVSIAHVAHYVNPNVTPHLFKEACERGCSVYIDDFVLPMLPQKLSNGICSLNPDVDRLTISTIFEMDKQGNIINGRIAKSIINSRAKMKYSVVNHYLEDPASVPGYQNVLGRQIKILNEVSEIIEKNLMKNGKKDFISNEIEIKCDEFNQPFGFENRSTGKAQKLIENLMIYANMYQSEHFMDYPFIYRIHDIPNEEKLEKIIDELKNNNYASLIKKDFDADNLNLLLDKINKLEDKEEKVILSNILLRCMSRAKYSTSNIGHYGLGLANYCHSTSPIRRLPDLLLQILFYLKEDDKKHLSKSEKANILNKLNRLCIKANSREIAEDDVEKESQKIKMINYMKNHIGENITATITDIGSERIYLTLDNNISGFSSLEDILFGSFVYNGNRNTLIDEYKGTKLSIGDKVSVFYNGQEKDNILEFMVNGKIKQKSRTLALRNAKNN